MNETPVPSPTAPRPWVRLLAWSLLVGAMLTVLVVYLRQEPHTQPVPFEMQREESLRVYGDLPDFQLTNRDGRSVSLSDLAGRPWVADFIFTSCQVSCPFLTAEMARLQAVLPAASETRLVSFSVDPDNDTPEVLQDYAQRYQAGDRWYFLTGARDELYRLIREGFQLGVEPGAGSAREPIAHSTRFVLVDREGRIRGYYESTDRASMAKLVKDLRSLL